MVTITRTPSMVKQIKIDDEDYHRLKAMGKGSFAVKVKQLLAKANTTYADDLLKQSIEIQRRKRPIPIDTATDLYRKDVPNPRLITALILDTWQQAGEYSRQALLKHVAELFIRQGWHEMYAMFFFNYEKRNSKFQKKVDSNLAFLVKQGVLKRVDAGYNITKPLSEHSKDMLHAITLMPSGSNMPLIKYNEKLPFGLSKYYRSGSKPLLRASLQEGTYLDLTN